MEEYNFEQSVSHLRGGTPFALYEYPYYISVAHSTLYKEGSHRVFYSAHIVVMCVEPYRIVHVTNRLEVHPQVFRDIPIIKTHTIDDGYIFPTTLLIEDPDSLIIGGHVSDHDSVIFRLRGAEALMRGVIEEDRKKNILRGPPSGFVQRHVHDLTESTTKMQFVHQRNVVNNW